MPRYSIFKPIGLSCVVLLLVSGCARYPRAEGEQSSADTVFSSVSFLAGDVGGSWGALCEDEVLAGLIAQGLSSNYSLRAAWHRLEQSGYALRSTRSSRYPQLTLQGAGGQQRQLLRDGGTASGDIWSASAALSYELDVWQRLSASVAGAGYRFEATAMDYEAMAVSMAAAISDAWLDVQAGVATVELLQQQLVSAGSALHAVERRFQEGLGALLDVYQQRELVAGLRSLVPGAEASVAISRERLALLLGRDPEALDVEPNGMLPNPVALTRDVDWLEHVHVRPDVRAAWLRLQAADQEVIFAARARLPLFRLSAQAVTREESAGDLLDEISGDALLQVTLPLLDGGRLRAEADRISAAAAERLESYRETELQALREIREALVLDAAQAETVARLREELDAARRTLELSRERYRNGLVEYLNVLAAQQRVQVLERGLLRAARQRLAYQVQFARATAGVRD